MQQSGIATDDNNEEARGLKQFIHQYSLRLQAQQSAQVSQSHTQPPNPPPVNSTSTEGFINGKEIPPMSPSPPITTVPFTDHQLSTLKAQMTAWKFIQRAAPVPEQIHQAARGISETPAPQGKFIEDPESLEHNQGSKIYPFNAFMSPAERLKEHLKDANGKKAFLMPTIFPGGLDAVAIVRERRKFIDARIDQRLKELNELASTIPEGIDSPPTARAIDGKRPTYRLTWPSSINRKLKLLIEHKALGLRQKQRQLRQQVVEKMLAGTVLPTERKDFRRLRKPTLRDARMTEAAERKQRLERERRAKQKHLDYLKMICAHGMRILSEKRNNLSKVQRLGKGISKFHSETEKEEQRRIERLSKERLRALKNDDEGAYLKLIDTAKDTRITHLLNQTDQYLDSLAQAVMAKQAESGGRPMAAHQADYEKVDETTFGASKMDEVDEKGKMDYYRVAHRISERITTQPSILVGGTLKEYQMKGLQWMVSLYNNKLDGILADEMG